MKNVVFLLTCILLVSCSTSSVEQESSIQEQIAQAANDDLYYDYQMQILAISEKLLTHEFDMVEVGRLVTSGKAPDCESLKTNSTLPENISNYFLLHCQSKETHDKLANRYPGIFSNNKRIEQVLLAFEKNNATFRQERELSFERLKISRNED